MPNARRFQAGHKLRLHLTTDDQSKDVPRRSNSDMPRSAPVHSILFCPHRDCFCRCLARPFARNPIVAGNAAGFRTIDEHLSSRSMQGLSVLVESPAMLTGIGDRGRQKCTPRLIRIVDSTTGVLFTESYWRLDGHSAIMHSVNHKWSGPRLEFELPVPQALRLSIGFRLCVEDMHRPRRGSLELPWRPIACSITSPLLAR